MFCTNCGASNKDGENLCVNCGESLRNAQIEDRISRLRGLNGASSSGQLDFLHSLFDFSFHRSVTANMMKFLYILTVLCAGLMALFFILAGFEASLRLGLFALLIGIAVFLFITVFTRVFLEMILVVFRMAVQPAGRGVGDRGPASVKEKAAPREGIQWNV